MNKGLNYSEKLEAYIRNELSETEKLELEEQLRQDPLLQNELILQRDIISSICDYRKNELKQRLNKIDVGGGRSTPGDFTVGGAILGGIAIVSVAGFLILKDSGKEIHSSQLSGAVTNMPYIQKDSSPIQKDSSPETESIIEKKEEVSASNNNSDSNVPEIAIADTHIASEVKKPAEKKVKPALESVPVVVEAHQELVKEEEIRKDDKLEVPGHTGSSLTAKAEPTLIIVDNQTSKYKLHYKYNNEQLFLYGFEKPYKIIDLPQQTQRYLLYDGNFYKLNRNQPQITPIQQVKNEQELKALQSFATQK